MQSGRGRVNEEKAVTRAVVEISERSLEEGVNKVNQSTIRTASTKRDRKAIRKTSVATNKAGDHR